jgi:hypothetical protein
MSLLDALDNAIAEVEAKKTEEKKEDPSPKEGGERIEGLQAKEDGEEDGEGEFGGEEAPRKGNRCGVPLHAHSLSEGESSAHSKILLFSQIPTTPCEH